MVFLKVLRKTRREEREMRVLFLGLDNAGKTTVVKALKGDDVNSVSPTLGFNIETFEHRGYRLNVWDIGGQRTIRPFWRNHFEKTDGLVWIVDSSDSLRFAACRHALEEVLQEERLLGASLLVLANKSDLGGARSAAQICEALGLRRTSATSHSWAIFASSAKTRHGLRDSFDWLVDDIAARHPTAIAKPPEGPPGPKEAAAAAAAATSAASPAPGASSAPSAAFSAPENRSKPLTEAAVAAAVPATAPAAVSAAAALTETVV